MRAVLGTTSYPDLAKTVFGRRADLAEQARTEERIKLAADMMRKGSKPTRKGPWEEFWDALPQALRLHESITGTRLVECSADEFAALFEEPTQNQAAVEAISRVRRAQRIGLQAVSTATRNTTTSPLFGFDIHVGNQLPIQTLEDGLRAGKIDQAHHYLDPGSARSWTSLILASHYENYERCQLSLEKMLSDTRFLEAVATSRPTAAVLLAGGGAPTKDKAILSRLLSQPHLENSTLNYFILDISFYMLESTMTWLRGYISQTKLFRNATLRAFRTNVLELGQGERDEFHRTGAALFIMTGGTIGNLPEALAMASLNRAAQRGDLFLVGIDTIDGQATGIEIANAYRTPELDALLRPAVQAALNLAESTEPVDTALMRKTFTLTQESEVPDTNCVAATLEISGKRLTLFTSARYLEPRFKAFVESKGWEWLSTIAAGDRPHFKQLLFRRN
ncbi:MAG: hypothetical protein EPN33_14385 [Acidobacteria bacterium]|nr:MAG: hypothetical protein EPN33_14385 [Acidobacteriota bacterium]